MLDTHDPAFWLDVTNIALGLFTAIAVLVTFGGLAWELARRATRSVSSRAATDPHALNVPGLGLTMADGGEPVDEEKSEAPQRHA